MAWPKLYHRPPVGIVDLLGFGSSKSQECVDAQAYYKTLRAGKNRHKSLEEDYLPQSGETRRESLRNGPRCNCDWHAFRHPNQAQEVPFVRGKVESRVEADGKHCERY
jgi:hypothetical protein